MWLCAFRGPLTTTTTTHFQPGVYTVQVGCFPFLVDPLHRPVLGFTVRILHGERLGLYYCRYKVSVNPNLLLAFPLQQSVIHRNKQYYVCIEARG